MIAQPCQRGDPLESRASALSISSWRNAEPASSSAIGLSPIAFLRSEGCFSTFLWRELRGMIRPMILSYKFRIKDASTKRHLERYARACNQVWNFCVATQREAESRWKAGRNVKWPSAFDLLNLTPGASSELGILSDSMSSICRQFVASRDAKGICPKFRASFGQRRAIGWLPFPARCIRINGDFITYKGRRFRFWKSREIEGTFKSGCFTQDARGRWYVVFQCEVADDLPMGNGQIGIDLGLKTLATCSDGTKIPALQHYRRYEAALAKAQRARNKRRVKAIHAKIANARRHNLHEWSTKIARENELIVVGNVSPTKLVKTRMAKSILDASWGILRSQLAYKARRHGARFIEADERWTSQTCSSCGARSGPKGIAGLRMRRFVCSDCGTDHDRDHNAALNILIVGAERRPLAGEIPV